MNEYLKTHFVASTANVAYYRVRGDSAKKFSDVVVDIEKVSKIFPHGTITLSIPLDEAGCDKVCDAFFDMAESHGFIYAPTLEMITASSGDITLNGAPFSEEELVEAMKLVASMI